jgi:hypothetical protein
MRWGQANARLRDDHLAYRAGHPITDLEMAVDPRLRWEELAGQAKLPVIAGNDSKRNGPEIGG